MNTTALSTSTSLASSASLASGVETGAKMLEIVSAACRALVSTRRASSPRMWYAAPSGTGHSAFSEHHEGKPSATPKALIQQGGEGRLAKASRGFAESSRDF